MRRTPAVEVGARRARSIRRRPMRGDDDGYSVLEAAIVLPVVLVLTMLVIQYSLLWHARHVAQAAAQDGLRAARVFGATTAAGQTAAAGYLQQVAPNLLTRARVDSTSTPALVTVRVRADVLSLLSFGSFTVDEIATGPRERFVAPAG